MKILIAAFIVSQSVGVFAQDVKKTFPMKEVKRIKLTNLSGKITVAGNAKDNVVVEAQKGTSEEHCEVGIKKEGDLLNIEVENKGGLFAKDCHVIWTLSLDPKTDLELKNGSGDMEISGIEGSVNFMCGSGKITLQGSPKEFSGKTGSGDIFVVGMHGKDTTKLRTGSGDIHLEFDKGTDPTSKDHGNFHLHTGSGDVKISNLRQKGEVKTGSGSIEVHYDRAALVSSPLKLKAGSGDIRISIPQETKIATDFHTGSGKLQNELGDTPGAPLSISASTGSGNISVHKL